MLYFLKLGGSLITEKEKPFTAKQDVISRIAKEIHQALKADDSLRLVIGHGSGSFGHAAASKFSPELASSNTDKLLRYQKIWSSARELHKMVMDEFLSVGLPAVSLPPSAAVTAENGKIAHWNTQPIEISIQHGLIPVIYGDVVFDQKLGAIILSTEELFKGLIPQCLPDSILICGKEKGVWVNYPQKEQIIQTITLKNYKNYSNHITESDAVDVTGGMASKIQLMLDIISRHPAIQTLIFSGEEAGNIYQVLKGKTMGTLITAK